MTADRSIWCHFATLVYLPGDASHQANHLECKVDGLLCGAAGMADATGTSRFFRSTTDRLDKASGLASCQPEGLRSGLDPKAAEV